MVITPVTASIWKFSQSLFPAPVCRKLYRTSPFTPSSSSVAKTSYTTSPGGCSCNNTHTKHDRMLTHTWCLTQNKNRSLNLSQPRSGASHLTDLHVTDSGQSFERYWTNYWPFVHARDISQNYKQGISSFKFCLCHLVFLTLIKGISKVLKICPYYKRN